VHDIRLVTPNPLKMPLKDHVHSTSDDTTIQPHPISINLIAIMCIDDQLRAILLESQIELLLLLWNQDH